MSEQMDKQEYKMKMDELSLELAQLQRSCKEAGIPVMIVFEGLDAAGKGTMISQLIRPLDPRGFQVHATGRETAEERLYPFLWRFWNRTPAKGRIAVFDRSWYRKVMQERFQNPLISAELSHAYEEIKAFEKQLTDDGVILIKFFLTISKEEQRKRFNKLAAKKETAWRVTVADRARHEAYEEYQELCKEAVAATDRPEAPWYVVDSHDRRSASVKILAAVVEYIKNKYDELTAVISEPPAEQTDPVPVISESVFDAVDLEAMLTREVYQQQRKKLQKKLTRLHGLLYQQRIPVVLAFEGWDAGGKGGAIKRLTEKLDPRGYVVNPVASPNDIERQHHYLWRFWQTMPKAGHIGIYDRSWYGRVMVERIEGFCTRAEWQRAYDEINAMEQHLVHSGAIVLKFWMHIDKDEQLRRFEARQNDPAKAWKITDEDWRNRDKWDAYEVAVNEMIHYTSTPYAPWIIVAGNSKYYARIKVLENVIDYIEKGLQEHEISQKSDHE